MPTPFFDLWQELKALEGAPKVTFPYGDVNYPVTERAMKAHLTEEVLAFQSAEPDAFNYPSNILVDQSTLEKDHGLSKVYRKYERIPSPWIYSTELSEDSEIVTTAKRKNRIASVSDGENNSGGILTKATHEGINDWLCTEIIVTRPLPGLIRIEYDQEDETGALITRTWQIMPTPVTPPTFTPGTITKVEKIDASNSMLIIESRSTPASYSEQENGAYNRPTLFDYTGYAYTDVCGAFADNQDGYAYNTKITSAVSYSTNIDSFVGLQVKPKTLQLGKYVSFEGILVDSGSFTYSGSCTGTVFFTASSPSYSTYTGSLEGTNQLIGGSSKRTKYGDYRTERKSALLV